MRGMVTVDDYTRSMGWDMMEMGMKWNMMMRMKIHVHKVRGGGMCLFNGRHTSGLLL